MIEPGDLATEAELYLSCLNTLTLSISFNGFLALSQFAFGLTIFSVSTMSRYVRSTELPDQLARLELVCSLVHQTHRRERNYTRCLLSSHIEAVIQLPHPY